jgi:hypothetical protein
VESRQDGGTVWEEWPRPNLSDQRDVEATRKHVARLGTGGDSVEIGQDRSAVRVHEEGSRESDEPLHMTGVRC